MTPIPEKLKSKCVFQPDRVIDAAEDKILPCPFCGNMPIGLPVAVNYGYAIYCSTCVYFGPWGQYSDVAVKAWNTRKTD